MVITLQGSARPVHSDGRQKPHPASSSAKPSS